MFNSKKSHKGYVIGAITGTILGVIAALALKTPRGKKIKEKVLKSMRLEEVFDKIPRSNIKSKIKKLGKYTQTIKNRLKKIKISKRILRAKKHTHHPSKHKNQTKKAA